MDKKEIDIILAQKEYELMQFLRDSDVTKEGFGTLLDNMGKLKQIESLYGPVEYNLNSHESMEAMPAAEPAGASFVEEKEPKAAKKAEAAPVESAPAEPAVKPCPKPEPKLTRQDMVTQLSFYASDKGGNVEVFPIMQSHGWNNLTAVPPEEYQTLLDEVKAAAGVA